MLLLLDWIVCCPSKCECHHQPRGIDIQVLICLLLSILYPCLCPDNSHVTLPAIGRSSERWLPSSPLPLPAKTFPLPANCIYIGVAGILIRVPVSNHCDASLVSHPVYVDFPKDSAVSLDNGHPMPYTNLAKQYRDYPQLNAAYKQLL